MKKKGVV